MQMISAMASRPPKKTTKKSSILLVARIPMYQGTKDLYRLIKLWRLLQKATLPIKAKGYKIALVNSKKARAKAQEKRHRTM